MVTTIGVWCRVEIPYVNDYSVVNSLSYWSLYNQLIGQVSKFSITLFVSLYDLFALFVCYKLQISKQKGSIHTGRRYEPAIIYISENLKITFAQCACLHPSFSGNHIISHCLVKEARGCLSLVVTLLQVQPAAFPALRYCATGQATE